MPERNYSIVDGYRFGFQNQEIDNDISSGFLAFDYRIQDPRIGRFLSIDPLSGMFPWNSPYAFSENRVIDGKELEGGEVVLVNKDKDGAIYNVGISNSDNSAIHIYAHGTPSSLEIAPGKWTSNPKDFLAVLQQSDLYKVKENNKKIIVILHSCRVGRSYFDENGNYVPSVAELLSASFPNLTIIAPDERDAFNSNGEIGPLKIEHPGNNRADYKKDSKGQDMLGLSDDEGNWNVFEGGKWIGQFDSDYDASSAPSTWDYAFNYEPVTIIKSGTVKANKLNIRSTPAFGNNVIGSMPQGSLVSLTGNTKGTWSEVKTESGGTGWISTNLVTIKIAVSINDEKKK